MDEPGEVGVVIGARQRKSSLGWGPEMRERTGLGNSPTSLEYPYSNVTISPRPLGAAVGCRLQSQNTAQVRIAIDTFRECTTCQL
jgi:hypothetical protein